MELIYIHESRNEQTLFSVGARGSAEQFRSLEHS